MDIRMPELNGVEAAEILWREFGPERLKIVAISASTFAHEQGRYASAGFDAFISKPFLAEDVYQCLADLLGVAYVYEEPLLSTVLAPVALPEELRARLQQAAAGGAVTKLTAYIAEVAAQGVAGQQVAQQLQKLCDDLDMEAILALLEACR
jgi:CheY-like chemotaxis protein